MLMSTRTTEALGQERRRRLQATNQTSGRKNEKATRDRGLAVPAAAWRAELAAGR